MKIVCDNCATKYSIADEKVRGKVFKIRCKKCSHIIVVRGGESGAPQEAAGGDGAFPGDDGATLAARGSGAPAPLGSGGGGDAVWHLVVDREQIGPLTPAEVRAKFAAGEVDVETYAWREGFADWLRLGSIEDFRDLGAAAPAQQPTHQEEGATRRTDTADLFASSSAADEGGDGASDLFGGGGASAPAPAAAPMAAAAPAEVFSSGGGANLFGAPEEAPAPVASRPARTSSPGFNAPAASNGGAAASAEASGRMTGQRNENSVLFSLNNLQALASGGGGGAAAPKPGVDTRPGFANSQTEGSGLIDIRAMAASTLAAAPASGGSSKSEDPVSFSAAPIFSPMAAPILMPAAPSGPPKWMWAILGVGVMAVLGIVTVGILLLTRKPAEPVIANNVPSPTGNTPAGLGQPPTATGNTPAAATGNTPAATGNTPAADKPAPKDEPAATHKDKHNAAGTKAEKAPKAEKGTKVAKNESSVAAPAPAPAPEAAPKRKKGGDALDDLLNSASPDKPAAAAPRKAAREESSGGGDDSSLPDSLTKSDIQGGMSKVRDRVNGCYGQYHVPGLASVQVTIGKNGRVSNANVTGTFAGTPTGACLEKAVKTASFPQAKNGTTITYPYVLR